MADTPSSLTPDEWRRICAVLDRLEEHQGPASEAALSDACRAEGVEVERVLPFLTARDEPACLPDEIPPDVLADVFSDDDPEFAERRLQPGHRLGPYELVAPLGAGGMGEVYRARDTRLGRTVALKILRPHLLLSAPARHLFEEEARAISSLNHPHVCTLYDVGHHDGVDYLAMEYVEGESLAVRLRRGPLPVAQAVAFGAQIAQALDAAHRRGIVHRDLKPANIMITRAGVKLLDFGVARATGTKESDAPGLDAAAGGSDPPELLGTPSYMSPEQLRGGAADGRSDIFACGVVLYEMLSGRRPFDGPDARAILRAVLAHDPPPLSSVAEGIPPALDAAIARCLAKDVEERWQSAADLEHHLRWTATATGAAGRHGATGPPWASRLGILGGRRAIPWAAAVLILASFIGWLALRRAADDGPRGALSVFAITPPDGVRFDLTHALSPDGRRIAFTGASADGTRELWIQPLDALGAQRVRGTAGAAYPFWSPDGRFVGFFADRKLKTAELANGSVRVVSEAGFGGGGTWSADDVILFSRESGIGTGLWRVAAAGGTPVAVTTADPGLSVHAWPRFLPDGERFLYTRFEPDGGGLYVGRFDSTDHRRILDAAAARTRAVLAGNVLFFVRDAALLAQRFDTRRLELTGEPVRVAENIETAAVGRAAFDASATGVVTYRQPAAGPLMQLTWLDRTGQPAGTVGAPARYAAVSLARSGLAVLAESRPERRGPAGGTIARLDVTSGAATPLFTGASAPVWSPDGGSIVFTRFGGQGPVPARAVLDSKDTGRPLADFGAQAYPTDWSPDGRTIVGSSLHADTLADIWIAPADGSGTVTYVVREPHHQAEGRISPDGRWLAYAGTDAQGSWEVYVRRFPDGGGVRRLSVGGGRSPRWRADGRELYYVGADGALMRVRIGSGDDFAAAAPEPLFRHEAFAGEPEAPMGGYAYDVSPDGARFLISVPAAAAPASPPLVVILNWRLPPEQ